MNTKQFYIISMLTLLLASCAEYLDVKPDRSLAVPHTLQDLEAMMSFENTVNANYPDIGDIASDYFYLTDGDYSALRDEVREVYSWHANAQRDNWSALYNKINYANIVLDAVDNVDLAGATERDRARVKGAAFFLRGFAFLHLANLYAPPYEVGENNGKLGLPLRLHSDPNTKSRRATLEETFMQIVKDLREAVMHLPVSTEALTIPSKPAAYAALARTKLVMGDYEQAGLYADSCLLLKNTLLDYNQLDSNSAIPIPLFNEEMLWYAESVGNASVFTQGKARVQPSIYNQYDADDLRKPMFFHRNPDLSYSFKGTYSRSVGLLFSGLALDEVYLIKAECAVRLGDFSGAKQSLGDVLGNRYKTGTWNDSFIPDDPAAFLRFVLNERMKELVYRGGIYWSDLRRLNFDERFARTLNKEIGGEIYKLVPNDARYTFLIPDRIMEHADMEQNKR